MNNDLLRMKLHPPTLTQVMLARPRLATLLDNALNVRLVLIAAPAGFGKSTLVTSWLVGKTQRLAWLSLDERDNDPMRFWRYVIAALMHADVSIGAEAIEILGATGTIEPAITSLANDLSALSGDIFLVLDDYHIIDNETIHSSLQFLVDNQPPALHLILLTRVDPPLRLARLRAQRQLVEIRAHTLQLTPTETADLLNDIMGLSLESKQVEALYQRTEGWITGLQLVGLSLQSQPDRAAFIDQFTGSHRYILDYLTEEVLHALSDDMRSFLLQTSILGRLCAGLCEAITGNPDSPRVFEAVRRQNLFVVPLDHEEIWFHYHHLFGEILRAMLKRDMPDAIPDLHLRAADWYKRQDRIEDAVTHVLRSGDMHLAKRMIGTHWSAIAHQGHVATALRWFGALPDDDDPALLLGRCWTLHLSGRTPEITPYLDRLDRLPQTPLIESQIAMLRSVIARIQGETDQALAYSKCAVDVVPSDMLHAAGPAWNLLAVARMNAWDFNGAIDAFQLGIDLAYRGGNLLSAFVSTFGLSAYLAHQGRLTEAEHVCQSALDRVKTDGAMPPAAGLLQIALARIEVERNQIDSASEHLQTGREIARPGAFSEAVRYGRYISAQIAVIQNNTEAAYRIFAETDRIIHPMNDPYLTGELHREWLSAVLNIGDIDTAHEKLKVLRDASTITRNPGLIIARKWMTARLLLEDNDAEGALDVLDPLIERMRASDSHGELLRLLALRAVTLHKLNRHDAAQSVLVEAIRFGVDQGYIRRWLDAGSGLVILLRGLIDGDDLSPDERTYVQAILSLCWTTLGTPRPSPNEMLLNPLSERELELLHLIDAGYSNQQIADALTITLHTVKKHTSNIYNKLGVTRRTQAVALAREKGLL